MPRWYAFASGKAMQSLLTRAKLAALLTACSGLAVAALAEPGISLTSEPIHPIPLSLEVDPDKAALGKQIFHEPQLSGNDSISCASCHPIESGGMDSKRYSNGIDNSVLAINTPTVLNSEFNFRQFWDGRAENIVRQISFPIQSSIEMGSNWKQVIEKISANPDYNASFSKLYPGRGITSATISEAISAYLKTLITPNSRFDQFLRGDRNAISANERQGYILFKSYGCSSCHQGVNVGGNMFERMGLIRDYFKERGNVTEADNGRFNVTGDERDRFRFKVPSLRNIELTAPYFHDGSAAELRDAVNVMARYQLGRRLPEADVQLIVAFLRTLTGEIPQ